MIIIKKSIININQRHFHKMSINCRIKRWISNLVRTVRV